MDRDKFKVGVYIVGAEVTAWQAQILRDLKESPHATLSVAITPDNTELSGRTNRPDSLLARLVLRQERRHLENSGDACQKQDLSSMLRSIPIIPLSSAMGKSVVTTTADRPLEAARSSGWDLVIALSDAAPLDSLTPLAQNGVWHFQHDNLPPEQADGHQAGLREVLCRLPYVRSSLLIRRAQIETDAVAYQTVSGVHHISFARTRNEHLWKLPFFVSRSIKRLHEVGDSRYFAALPKIPRPPVRRPTGGPPILSNSQLLSPMLSYTAWRLASKLLRSYYTERWILLYKLLKEDIPYPAQPASFARLIPPTGRFWADPYAVWRHDRYYVFFEDACLATGHGHISVLEIGVDGTVTEPQPVINRTYHLSYPFLFEWNGELFMIPESADNRTIEAYRCTKFPYSWEPAQQLMGNISAYDSTLIERNGLWWLFANVKAHPVTSSWDELCLFYADNPLSRNWQPHPKNPIVSDVRYARPAGRLFVADGELYRPSQDSSYRYGYGLNINRVLELTTTEYREEVAQTVRPNWDPSILAVHTLSKTHKLMMLDAIHRSRRNA